MPPCESVLLNKINRTLKVTRMIKSCKENLIVLPEANDGYCLNESNVFSIEYFSGSPYPENIADLLKGNVNNNHNNNLDSDDESSDVCSSDDELDEDLEYDD